MRDNVLVLSSDFDKGIRFIKRYLYGINYEYTPTVKDHYFKTDEEFIILKNGISDLKHKRYIKIYIDSDLNINNDDFKIINQSLKVNHSENIIYY